MMRSGISMEAAGATEIGMYMDILAHASKQAKKDEVDKAFEGDKKSHVYLRKGTIDEVFG